MFTALAATTIAALTTPRKTAKGIAIDSIDWLVTIWACQITVGLITYLCFV